MSSDGWPSVRSVGGILSPDPAENPYFADFNHVFVPYCSSDSWSGTKRGSRGQLSFMGSHIVAEVIKELADYNQLLYGRELFLAGSSAGATGVLINVDHVAGMLSKVGIPVRGIVDSGWFLDNDPFKTEGSKASVIEDIKSGVVLWKAKVPKACQDKYPNTWQCFIGYRAEEFIKCKFNLLMNQLDPFVTCMIHFLINRLTCFETFTMQHNNIAWLVET